MMKYEKKAGSMTNPKGMCSTRNNPMAPAKMTKPTSGAPLASPANSDQSKVRSLRAKAYTERDSLRGANGI